MNEDVKARMWERIVRDVFVRAKDSRIVMRGIPTESHWVFDFRAVFLEPAFLDDIVHLFWKSHPDARQIGGMEILGIPFVTALVYAGNKEFGKNATGFFIRKSRKKDGLMKALEGTLRLDVPVILVDDIINSGGSLIKQIETVEKLGGHVTHVWTLMRFRDMEQYAYFTKKGIVIESLFTLDDFANLGVQSLPQEQPRNKQCPFTIAWTFASPQARLEYVLPKSDIALDENKIYFGSDVGTLWALNQSDGNVAWSFKTGLHAGKGIFSSPALARGCVFFGGYDGNVYALHAAGGTTKWVAPEGDWIGSSPAIADDLGLLFIGLEYGLWKKRGGIVALDIETGKRKWLYGKMPCLTHSSPLYIKEHQQVVIGSNDGAAYLFDANTGMLQWKCETGTLTAQELNSGFSAHDIKESFVYDARRDLIIFGTLNGCLFFVDRKLGVIAHTFQAEYGFFSTPVICRDTILTTSLDKNLYCIDLNSFKEKWRWNANARIFATPLMVNGSIYIGSNSGKMVELDFVTGREISFLQLTERIVNKIAYNPVTKRFFVPTQANEVYGVEYAKIVGSDLDRSDPSFLRPREISSSF